FESGDVSMMRLTIDAVPADLRPFAEMAFVSRWFIKENSFSGKPAEVWVPMALPAQQGAARRGRYLSAVARLKPGVSVEQARREMGTIASRLEAQYADLDKG